MSSGSPPSGTTTETPVVLVTPAPTPSLYEQARMWAMANQLMFLIIVIALIAILYQMGVIDTLQKAIGMKGARTT